MTELSPSSLVDVVGRVLALDVGCGGEGVGGVDGVSSATDALRTLRI